MDDFFQIILNNVLINFSNYTCIIRYNLNYFTENKKYPFLFIFGLDDCEQKTKGFYIFKKKSWAYEKII
jgi:hypothetical protein